MTVFTACSGKKNKTETTVPADSNVTVDQNTSTDGVDENTTVGGSVDDSTTTGGGDDNATNGGNDDNITTGDGTDDDNVTTGGSNDNTSSGGGSDVNTTTSGGADDNVTTGGSDGNATAGSTDDNATTGGGTTDTTLALSSLSLESNTTTANKGETVQLLLTGTYSDNSTKAVNANVIYTITPADSAKVNGSILTALKDGNVTVQATVGGVVSNSVKLHITWVVNGHVLPPEPDKALNDSTLLGVDSNNNGVRDDVERWIYKTYDHPIERGIFMQSARAYQKVIVDPKKAHETMKYIVNATHCESYWSMGELRMKKRHLHYTIGEYRDIEQEIRSTQFNTLGRIVAYHRFNKKLSGGVFGDSLKPDEWGKLCEFDKNGNLKAQR